MASSRVKLDPQTVDAIARRVVELLRQRERRMEELVDAAEVARRLGVDRSWVYTHAIELGALKLGDGRRPRLRFDPRVAVERMWGAERTADQRPPLPRRRRPSSYISEASPLLPIKGGES